MYKNSKINHPAPKSFLLILNSTSKIISPWFFSTITNMILYQSSESEFHITVFASIFLFWNNTVLLFMYFQVNFGICWKWTLDEINRYAFLKRTKILCNEILTFKVQKLSIDWPHWIKKKIPILLSFDKYVH